MLNSKNKARGLYFSKVFLFEGVIYGGACIIGGACTVYTVGNLHYQIDWVSLYIVGRQTNRKLCVTVPLNFGFVLFL